LSSGRQVFVVIWLALIGSKFSDTFHWSVVLGLHMYNQLFGTDVRFFNFFRQNIWRKMAFLTQNNPKLYKNWIITVPSF
jgi:hypothetical protein